MRDLCDVADPHIVIFSATTAANALYALAKVMERSSLALRLRFVLE
jgi:hypothetical protein